MTNDERAVFERLLAESRDALRALEIYHEAMDPLAQKQPLSAVSARCAPPSPPRRSFSASRARGSCSRTCQQSTPWRVASTGVHTPAAAHRSCPSEWSFHLSFNGNGGIAMHMGDRGTAFGTPEKDRELRGPGRIVADPRAGEVAAEANEGSPSCGMGVEREPLRKPIGAEEALGTPATATRAALAGEEVVVGAPVDRPMSTFRREARTVHAQDTVCRELPAHAEIEVLGRRRLVLLTARTATRRDECVH